MHAGVLEFIRCTEMVCPLHLFILFCLVYIEMLSWLRFRTGRQLSVAGIPKNMIIINSCRDVIPKNMHFQVELPPKAA